MVRGFVPKEMEDRWFIFYEEGWLYFHRSWTGFCVYALRLESVPAGVRVAESWVSRDPAEYTCTDLDEDRETVAVLIRNLLLDRREERRSATE